MVGTACTGTSGTAGSIAGAGEASFMGAVGCAEDGIVSATGTTGASGVIAGTGALTFMGAVGCAEDGTVTSSCWMVLILMPRALRNSGISL